MLILDAELLSFHTMRIDTYTNDFYVENSAIDSVGSI